MSGICFAHQHREPGCRLCAVLSDADLAAWHAETLDWETVKCPCGCVYYATTDRCPRCERENPRPAPAGEPREG